MRDWSSGIRRCSPSLNELTTICNFQLVDLDKYGRIKPLLSHFFQSTCVVEHGQNGIDEGRTAPPDPCLFQNLTNLRNKWEQRLLRAIVVGYI
jgi:hypothetical protein